MKRFFSYFATLILVALVASPAFAKNTRKTVLDGVTLTVNVANTQIISNTKHTTGYLVVVTSSEVAAASLVITVALLGQSSSPETICTSTAITTNTTTTILMGSLATAGEGIVDVCDFPLANPVVITFFVTGAGSSFVTDVDLVLVGN